MGRWASLDEPDLEIFSGFRRFTASGWNFEVLKKPFYTEEEISKFEDDVKNWVRTFCQPTIGQMNSATLIPGLYRKEDVTPYMHILTIYSLLYASIKRKGTFT
ncbi:hypothetical protein GLOIN_2v1815132 [Rhizophagus irregularis DAOM 181602=DAOM 197198]|nr:hypothetical protein GLOIN_2v1815132 [Rhizophagus irregularis DAOM 181602=DAOM 197198]